MTDSAKISAAGASQYKSSLTCEQFLFKEMRTTAKFIAECLDDKAITESLPLENTSVCKTAEEAGRYGIL